MPLLLPLQEQRSLFTKNQHIVIHGHITEQKVGQLVQIWSITDALNATCQAQQQKMMHML
eukprot:2894739-Ditylum_brightwellii.AAC.1